MVYPAINGTRLPKPLPTLLNRFPKFQLDKARDCGIRWHLFLKPLPKIKILRTAADLDRHMEELVEEEPPSKGLACHRFFNWVRWREAQSNPRSVSL